VPSTIRETSKNTPTEAAVNVSLTMAQQSSSLNTTDHRSGSLAEAKRETLQAKSAFSTTA